jgi:hypothetical protein
MNKIVWLSLLCLSYACSKNGLFDAGPTVTQEIVLNQTFGEIDADQIFDIILVQDTLYKILVTCGQNLQKDVNIYIRNNILHLDQNTAYNWSRPYNKIQLEFHLVQMPQLNIYEPIELTSKGTLTMPSFSIIDFGKFSEVNVNLNVNYCQVSMSSDNFGYYQVNGTCNTADLTGWGSSIVRADSMVTKQISVIQKGWGSVYVNCTSTLEVSIESTGSVFYAGHPDSIIIDKQTQGGQLIPINN